jgi:hypothetical protein
MKRRHHNSTMSCEMVWELGHILHIDESIGGGSVEGHFHEDDRGGVINPGGGAEGVEEGERLGVSWREVEDVA